MNRVLSLLLYHCNAISNLFCTRGGHEILYALWHGEIDGPAWSTPDGITENIAGNVLITFALVRNMRY